MENQNDKLDILLDRLESIIKRQESFSAEIDTIRKEIIRIKMSTPDGVKEYNEELVPEISQTQQPDVSKQETDPPLVNTGSNDLEPINQPIEITQTTQKIKVQPDAKLGVNFEKLIGENLINKLGIAITIIGVAIGAKYSIDNNLINPLTRIILGYLMGVSFAGCWNEVKTKLSQLQCSTCKWCDSYHVFYYICCLQFLWSVFYGSCIWLDVVVYCFYGRRSHTL